MGKKSDGALSEMSGPLHARANVPAHAAADATADHPVFRAPFACKVRGVKFVPGATLTGADTNSCYLRVINRGADGLGTTALGSTYFSSGTNATGGDASNLYAPASPLAIAQDVVLAIQREKIGGGLATPDLFVEVEYEAN